MRNRLYSPNASLHPGVKMGASELSWKHYEMEGDNLWWTGILSRGCRVLPDLPFTNLGFPLENRILFHLGI